jgi:hypothetical protein
MSKFHIIKKIVIKRFLCTFRLKGVKSDDIVYYYERITVNVPSKQLTGSVSHRNRVTDVLVYVS